MRLRQLFVDIDAAMLKVHTVPRQSQYFTLPHACKKRNEKEAFKAVAFNCINEFPNVVLFQRDDFFFVHLRKIAGFSWIILQLPDPHSLIQSLMEDSVDVLNGLR